MIIWVIRKILWPNVFKSIAVFLILIFFVFFQAEEHPNFHRTDYEAEILHQRLRPWYFQGGLVRPKHQAKTLKLWPKEAENDRILDQLMYVPLVEPVLSKKIFIESLQKSKVPTGSQIFLDLGCPVKNCEVVSNETNADAVIFEDFITRTRKNVSSHQVWILHSLESPYFSGKVIQQSSVNWTATYRLDSDLVTPYGKWVFYDERRDLMKPRKNFAAGKNKKVAWVVSNCYSKNKRLQYAKSLAQYISVDIYGICGNKVCLKELDKYCREMISNHYKFYLSFENANCRDYITEKFFYNALRFNVIPIVMGAPKEDYVKVAPRNSFIHVEDFESPKALADYLHFLDKNDKEYNSYFWWKGAGEFINTSFMCRLCALLHANRPNHFYKKISHWWKNSDTCTKTFWNKTNKNKIIKSLKSVKKL